MGRVGGGFRACWQCLFRTQLSTSSWGAVWIEPSTFYPHSNPPPQHTVQYQPPLYKCLSTATTTTTTTSTTPTSAQCEPPSSEFIRNVSSSAWPTFDSRQLPGIKAASFLHCHQKETLVDCRSQRLAHRRCFPKACLFQRGYKNKYCNKTW